MHVLLLCSGLPGVAAAVLAVAGLAREGGGGRFHEQPGTPVVAILERVTLVLRLAWMVTVGASERLRAWSRRAVTPSGHACR